MNSQGGTYFQEFGSALFVVPPQASAGAVEVDWLALGLLLFTVALVAAVAILMGWFCYRYRAGSSVERKPLTSEGHQTRIEILWAVGLFSFFMIFFVWGATVYLDLFRAPEEALTIKVVGKQWMWKVQHPNGAREIDTLHVPVNRPVRLEITSQDVIHSFFVPAFRLKHDAVPGMISTIGFTATEIGVYHLFCAEYCGTNHSRMRGKVVVMSQEDYSAWLAARGHDQTPAVAGKQLFRTYGCSGCHMGSSVVDAPKLAGIYGRAVPLSNGTTIIADEAYLRDSILRPRKHVVAGYIPVMPSFAGRISDSDLQKIIAYIRSLEPGDWLNQELGDTQ